jgi:hypothetical protein
MLQVGRRHPGGCLARLDDDPAVLVIADDLCRALLGGAGGAR